MSMPPTAPLTTGARSPLRIAPFSEASSISSAVAAPAPVIIAAAASVETVAAKVVVRIEILQVVAPPHGETPRR